jgi:serine/threonine-protein kinase
VKVCPTCNLKYGNDDERCYTDNAVLVPMPDARLGTVLNGRYSIEAQLGEGGMAIVYRARNTLVDRVVAVKVLNKELARDPKMSERFRREAKNTAALAHPNIVEILDYGAAEDGSPYLAMELLDGQPLDKLIARGPMPIPQAAALGAHVARGLARAHDFGVVHRDLKPENVFVTRGPSGRAVGKILDFGIARSMHDQRLTSAGQIFGTPQYMAPESVTSIDAGPAADLYALGVMLFEMTTGRPPFQATDVTAFLIAHMQETPPRPSSIVSTIPRRMEELILKLLEKRPEDRPVDAHQVDKELSALAPPEEASADLADSHQSVLPRAPAATLAPAALDEWTRRALIFEEMLRRAFATQAAPGMVTETLGHIHGTLQQIESLRGGALREHRKLESMEQMAREGRTRLGHAMSTLGTDLSQARTAARQAELEVRPYFEPVAAAERTYREAFRKLATLGGASEANAPSIAVVAATREVADAMDRWLLAHGTSEKARSWIESKTREVKDLEFQCDALRAQLEKLETGYEEERRSLEASIATAGREIDAMSRSLEVLGGRFVEPLRGRRELADLFAQLDVKR